MNIDGRLRQALVDKILLSPFLRKKPDSELFVFLLRQESDRKLSAKEIEEEHFERPHSHRNFDEATSRSACLSLRRALQDFGKAHPEEHLTCVLPDGKQHGGYQIIFAEATKATLATEWFWRPHLNQIEHLRVIGGDLLFFFEPSKNRVFRYYEFNASGSDQEIKTSLKLKNPESWKKELGILRHSYLSTGEVKAFEILQKWFFTHKQVLLERQTSMEFGDEKILRLSPILIGRPVTNRHMNKIVNKCGFQVGEILGSIKITKLTARERSVLSSFPLSRGGILGPSIGWKTIFGVVARRPNPSGYGHVTVISADSQANVYSEIVRALTDEELFRNVLEKTGWSLDGEVPETFELLFAVTRDPEGFSGESKAELLLSRP